MRCGVGLCSCAVVQGYEGVQLTAQAVSQHVLMDTKQLDYDTYAWLRLLWMMSAGCRALRCSHDLHRQVLLLPQHDPIWWPS